MQIELGPELEEFRQGNRSWVAETRQDADSSEIQRSIVGERAPGLPRE